MAPPERPWKNMKGCCRTTCLARSCRNSACRDTDCGNGCCHILKYAVHLHCWPMLSFHALPHEIRVSAPSQIFSECCFSPCIPSDLKIPWPDFAQDVRSGNVIMLCRTFLFFAACCTIGTAFVYWFLPECKGLHVEEVHEVFRRHWFWKRYPAPPRSEIPTIDTTSSKVVR